MPVVGATKRISAAHTACVVDLLVEEWEVNGGECFAPIKAQQLLLHASIDVRLRKVQKNDDIYYR